MKKVEMRMHGMGSARIIYRGNNTSFFVLNINLFTGSVHWGIFLYELLVDKGCQTRLVSLVLFDLLIFKSVWQGGADVVAF